MPAYNLIDLNTVLRLLGRGTVWYAHDGATDAVVGDPIKWDGTTPLRLAQLGDTEGDITMSPNGTVAELHLNEISGDAVHEAISLGENPTLSIPLYLADPDLLPIVSPTGLRHAGHQRVRDTAKRTIVIMPEELFKDGSNVYQELTYAGGVWKLDGVALDEAHQTLRDRIIWCWRCYIERPDESLKGGHGDDGKNLETVTVHMMMDPDMPDGHRLYTKGNPWTYGIDLDGAS